MTTTSDVSGRPNEFADRQPDASQLAILSRGVKEWNAWRREHPYLIPNLRRAPLAGARLAGVNLSNAMLMHANLEQADLSLAHLYQAELYNANLRLANLRSAEMSGAKLHRSSLESADLENSDLYRADFIESKLKGTLFEKARFESTAFSNVDLAEAIGLDNADHSGPSHFDAFTLLKSRSAEAERFFRAAGVPDVLLTYLPSIASALEPIQFYSCFISYSHRDETFTKRLHARLCENRLGVWFAPEDMRAGRKVFEQVYEGIHMCDKVLLVLSEHSMASEWVATEIYHARQREQRERRKVLFPIRLCSFDALKQWTSFDGDTGKDMAREIREYFVPDFSAWQDPAEFERAFARLLHDLRAGTPGRLNSGPAAP